MWRDCGENPILISAYLTGIALFHRIDPLQKMRWERNSSQVRSPSNNTKLSQRTPRP